jgi:DNA processing protein
VSACADCLARAWLIGRLAGHLDNVSARIDQLLLLGEHELIAAVGGKRTATIERELAEFDPHGARARASAVGIELVCRCDGAYPQRLGESPSCPAVLHVAGDLGRLEAIAAADPVAIVGARKASAYGLDVARALGRGLACAGVTVISGMAMGIDSAAHAGALSVDRQTMAVLPGPADHPYPSAKRGLYKRLVAGGAALSEMPPGAPVRRWMFPARNRIIAALAAMTVVVEAGERSGALLTAAFAHQLDRPVGAVPGRVTSPGSVGAHELLAQGAQIIRGPADVLEAIGADAGKTALDPRPKLEPELRRLLSAIASGRDTAGALAQAGLAPERGLAALASLELAGYVRREAGGRYAVLP